MKKTALHEHYKKNRREGVVVLDSVKFSKQMMCMLEDNYRDGKSFRDQYYFGIELLSPESETPQNEPNSENRTNPFVDDD